MGMTSIDIDAAIRVIWDHVLRPGAKFDVVGGVQRRHVDQLRSIASAIEKRIYDHRRVHSRRNNTGAQRR